MGIPTGRAKFGHLEAARGIASIVVVFHHLVLGFLPWVKDPLASGGLAGTPVFLIVNGNAAVVFFFVLSGFVLTRRSYEAGTAGDLLASALKRLPRLMLPAGLSILAGYLVLTQLAPWYISAGRLTGSSWLAGFAYAAFPPEFRPSPGDALMTGLAVFLQPRFAYYNSSLWTMNPEFLGSMLVFGIAAIFISMKTPSLLRVALLHLVAVIGAVAVMPTLVSFVIGSAMAFLHVRRPGLFQLGRWPALACLVIAALPLMLTSDHAALTPSAAIFLGLLLAEGPLQTGLLAGRTGRLLGRLSFPIYLVHVLVVLSTGSAVLTLTSEAGLGMNLAKAMAIAASLVGTLVAALPFMWVEEVWVPFVSRIARRVVRAIGL